MKTKQFAKIDRLFNKAVKAWIDGNNSGSSERVEKKNKECDRARNKAEILLHNLFNNIEIDYPGLYPSFLVDGFNYYDVESLERLYMQNDNNTWDWK